MIERKALVEFARTYLSTHPEEIRRLAKNIVLLRFGLPLEALRFVASKAKGRKAPRDIVIEAVPPGLRFVATVDLMKTPVRAAATLYIEQVRLSPEELRFELRLQNVSLQLVGDAETPIAGLIRSGALDLSKPGNLVAFMPKRPPSLVEAAEDRIVIDLMKEPKIARKVGRFTSVLTPVVGVKSIRTEADHLDIYWDYLPQGFASAVAAVRGHL